MFNYSLNVFVLVIENEGFLVKVRGKSLMLKFEDVVEMTNGFNLFYENAGYFCFSVVY